MSKLGAICDKLRQNGHIAPLVDAEESQPESDEIKTLKRELSPANQSLRPNKRKNFRPISLNNRHEKSEESSNPSANPSSEDLPLESERTPTPPTTKSAPEPSSFDALSVCVEDSQKQPSVIVRNPVKPASSSRSSPASGAESSPYHATNLVAQQYRYNNGFPSVLGMEESARRAMGLTYGGSHVMFPPQQYFPFLDYRTMSMMYPSSSANNMDDSTNLEDDEDDESVADSEDGKISNSASEQQSGNLSHDRGETSSQHDSDGWKWSGVRNSIRSLDIWQYVKHYRNDETCQSAECRALGLKEHFHCLTCPNKVIFRKEEMIRHVKWHKKRDETLQLGFLRFSGSDDCSQQFNVCPHAGRQTHYHCLMTGCDKVYTSTSDVQMHANLHRKEMAINKEGFRRYRAVDDCREKSCPFREQKSTHFHCIRSSCTFTFKNKADMEKHKAYHAKNDELAKDGFRKYMKYEHCLYDSCPYSKIMNHIHCIRNGCRYVFTSSAQLHAHKRKHDKNDVAYLPTGSTTTNSIPQQSPDDVISNFSSDSQESEFIANNNEKSSNFNFSSDEDDEDRSNSYMDLSKKPNRSVEKAPFNLALLRAAEAANRNAAMKDFPPALVSKHGEYGSPEARKNMTVSHSLSDFAAKDGGSFSGGKMADFGGRNLRSDHGAVGSSVQRRAFSNGLSNGRDSMPSVMEKLTGGRGDGSGSASTFGSLLPSSPMLYPPFKRKRGRPPKNPVIDVHVFPSTPSANHNPQAMFSSFKLGKGGVLMDIRQESASGQRQNIPGCSNFGSQDKPKERNILPKLGKDTERLPNKSPNCTYQSCFYEGKDHCHCSHPRCHFASERDDILLLHSREFHANIEILEGYEFFDQSVDCGLPGCPSNRLTRHFHCTRPNCLYSFVRYDTMATHEEKHRTSSYFPSHSSPSFSASHPGFPENHPNTKPECRLIKTEEFEEGRFFFHPMMSRMHYSPEKPCMHRICRMAEREHFHCDRCQQPYTSPLRLQTHLTKCRAEPPSPPPPSLTMVPSKFPVEAPSPSLRSSPSDSDESAGNGEMQKETMGNQKKIKFISVAFPQNGRANGQQHQPVPDGFQRFLCTETCDWEECPLTRKQTHWHCQEDHCRQFFSDKTRLMRHSERHRRLATIIGEDFQRYSSKVSCDDEHCSLKHSSHVHCLQCEFTCTETAKIATHRRSHSKQSAVAAAGFDKFSFRAPCGVPSCLYYTQTHYHCKTCSVVVNTMSQMQMHQGKHDLGYVENSEQSLDIIGD